MLTIGIVPNLGKAQCDKVVGNLCALLQGKAEIVLTDEVFYLSQEKAEKNKNTLEDIARTYGARVLRVREFFDTADMVVVTGGDGSLLRATSGAAMSGKPILGINLGRVGYLASAEKGSLEKVAEQLLAGNYTINEHLMLTTQCDGKTLLALNDVVISRSEMGKILEFSIYIDDEYVDTYTADGVVIATPTGSTAYSLSAGGPVAYPYMEMLIITPICAHGLSSRPIVVPADKKITVKLGNKYNYRALVSADGYIIKKLTTNGTITVKKADKKTKLIKTNDYGFYELLRMKLKGN